MWYFFLATHIFPGQKGVPAAGCSYLPNFFGLDWGKSYAYRYIQIVDIVSVDAI